MPNNFAYFFTDSTFLLSQILAVRTEKGNGLIKVELSLKGLERTHLLTCMECFSNLEKPLKQFNKSYYLFSLQKFIFKYKRDAISNNFQSLCTVENCA